MDEFADSGDYWPSRRPWMIHENTIYVGDPGTAHTDLAQKYKIAYAPTPDEGYIINDIPSDGYGNFRPEVQRYYDKHIRHANISAGMWRMGVDRPDGLAPHPTEWHDWLPTAHEGEKWAFVNGQVAFGPHWPQLVYDLAKGQGLEDADRLSNQVAINFWPGPYTESQIAVGDVRSGMPQILKSNLDRETVFTAVQAHLDNSA